MKFGILGFGIQLKKSGTKLTIRIRIQDLLKNPGIQYLESGIHRVDSRIQDCPGSPLTLHGAKRL